MGSRSRRFLLGLVLCGCGQQAGTVDPVSSSEQEAETAAKKKKATVTVSPATVTLAPGATQQFTATASNSSSVTWTASTGTIDANGLYTAPQSGTDTVVATAGSGSADASVTVGSQTSSCLGDGSALEAACVTSANGWGTAMSAVFGRLDGTLTAIAKPSDSQCNQSNSTHFVLELTANGAEYPLVVNVDDSKNSSGGNDVYFAETNAALSGVAWQEGWHTDSGEKLDYAKNLGISSTAFQPYAESALVNAIVCELVAGDPVSVYGLGWGDNGAHDIHRNSGGGGADGAVVLHATTAPHYLMFRFVDQSF